MAMTGEPDGSPMRAGFSVCDTTTGLNAALAISAALYQRRNTNTGQYIDVAMLDCAISLASQTVGSWLNGEYVQPRRANLSVSHEPTGDAFRTADGSVMLAIMRDEHVMIFLRVLGRDELVSDPRFASREARVANAPFIRSLVQAELMKAPSSEWKRRLDEAGVPCSLILEIPEALRSPRFAIASSSARRSTRPPDARCVRSTHRFSTPTTAPSRAFRRNAWAQITKTF